MALVKQKAAGWDENAKQFTWLIGYHQVDEGTPEERLLRTRWYFGDHQQSAAKRADQMRKDWKVVVAKAKELTVAARLISPNAPKKLPFWSQEWLQSHGVAELPKQAPTASAKGSPGSQSNITIAEAKELYLKAKRKLVGLSGGVGIKPGTFNGIATALPIALGLSTSQHNDPKVVRKPIDLTMRLSVLRRSDLESYRNFWMALPGGIASRTAINYCNAFKAFLRWCHNEEAFGFTMPRGADDVFNFRGMKRGKVEPFNPKRLQTFLQTAMEKNDKTALYVLLAFNAGYYQSDIGALKQGELRVIDGEPYLWHKRTKEDGVDEDDDDGKAYSLVWLWPETYALLKKHLAPQANPFGRLFLNKQGMPLWREELDKRKNDAVGSAYDDLFEEGEAKFDFRQWRKQTWNAMERIGGSEAFARKWAGQAVGGTALFYKYTGEEELQTRFKDVTAALKQWHAELVAAKVLPEVKETKAVA